MIDRVDPLALSSNDEHFPERFGYKYALSRQNDGWAEGITVETLLSPIDDETFVDSSLYFDDTEANPEEDAEVDPSAEENIEEDVEIALADTNPAAKKAENSKKAAAGDDTRASKTTSSQDDAENNVVGSGAPIDLNPPETSFEQLSIGEGSFNGFSQQSSILNANSLADPIASSGPHGIFQNSVQAQSGEQGSSATPSQSAVTNSEVISNDNTREANEDPQNSLLVTVDDSIDAATLNQLIATADAGSTILMTSGLYAFDQCILIDRSDITLKGESESGTIIQFDFADGQATDGIKIISGSKSYVGTANSGIAKGENSLVIEDNSLKSGDTLYIFQHNTREWLDANGWQNVSMDDADHRPFREVIVEVDHVEGDMVFFTHSVPYSMDAGKVKLNSVDLLENVAISDFTVTYNLGTPDAHDFSNIQPEYAKTAAISIVGTIGASVEHISIKDFASKGLVIGTSIDMIVDDIYVSGSHNKGGGNGYGVLLFETNNSSLTNLEIFDTRHGFTTSSWSAETDNIIHISDTNRDIGFLGSPDRGNVITVDNAILDFDVPFTGNGGSSWSMVTTGGSNHALIDPFLENDFNFSHAEGANRSETITAGDNGSYLNGKYGYDTLISGQGDDYLVGGTLSDRLTGGEGSDTFLLRVGDGLDTITDFEFGNDGDTLLISNQPLVDSFDDLFIYAQDGNARVVYGRNSTVILEGVDVASIDPSNFSFDPSGDITAANYFGSDFDIA